MTTRHLILVGDILLLSCIVQHHGRVLVLREVLFLELDSQGRLLVALTGKDRHLLHHLVLVAWEVVDREHLDGGHLLHHLLHLHNRRLRVHLDRPHLDAHGVPDDEHERPLLHNSADALVHGSLERLHPRRTRNGARLRRLCRPCRH